MAYLSVVLLAFLGGLWVGLASRRKANLYAAWSEGYAAATKSFLATYEALKATPHSPDAFWCEAGWHTMVMFRARQAEVSEPRFRTADQITIEQFLADLPERSDPGGYLGDPDK